MRVLVHYAAPGTPPLGVWWMKGSRSTPQARYVDDAWKVDGARAIFGTDHDGEPLSLARWYTICDRLTGTQNPFLVFSDHETKTPETLLLSLSR
jgi:hypothetical protein